MTAFLRSWVSRTLVAAAVGAAALAAPATAGAFCRSTTCTGDCPRDQDTQCKTKGAQLWWASQCIGFSLQKDGTSNIPIVQVRKIIERSFATWSAISCDPDTGAEATIALAPAEDVACHKSEYAEDKPNANIVLFQDNTWTYTSLDNNLAKTIVTYDDETGEIFDADIEINTANNHFTVSDQNVDYDLQSVVTHEVGHFLGLDHSVEFEATMNAAYDKGSATLRDLDQDDVDGLCAIYPPGRKAACNTEPRGGHGYECTDFKPPDDGGCSVSQARSPRSERGSASGPRSSGAGVLAALFALTTWAARRRSRRACPASKEI